MGKVGSNVMNVESGGFGEKVAAWPARLKEYVGELQAEMRRVTWPTWKQVQSTTVVVLIAVFFFAAYFFLVDLFLNRTVTRMIDKFTK